MLDDPIHNFRACPKHSISRIEVITMTVKTYESTLNASTAAQGCTAAQGRTITTSQSKVRTLRQELGWSDVAFTNLVTPHALSGPSALSKPAATSPGQAPTNSGLPHHLVVIIVIGQLKPCCKRPARLYWRPGDDMTSMISKGRSGFTSAQGRTSSQGRTSAQGRTLANSSPILFKD